ncbi:hypothetical protein A9G45_10945 [Gilliamella sp. HK2]|uniref:hypothetical protein n=1 Tax=Gilliamella sp. HK7 TaxID=3120247 RepID=UPI00080D9794|nr:hypothetical protein [Gilliamella apicola]OCG24132.1 hypothetical protein A9G46_09115 [Gilliamella apicola]OCG26398.1 hypothetical protein A9G45_10945 [Gilliamella apicola]
MSDNNVKTRQHRAVDEQDTLWIYIEKALDDKNITMSPGWLSTESEGVKKVSCWDWFDFKQIKENASLKDIYLSAKKTLSRNKDNASLEQYTPTIKETLTILDKQYNSSDQKYAKIDINSFNKIINKPILASSLGRLLIHYESEWYGKLDSEGKLPKWEALNSEMTENVSNVLDYLTEGDEVKLDAYINTLETSKQQSEKKGFEALRRKIERLPEDYKSNPQKKLNKGQLEIYTQIQKLEQKVMAWDKTKEKIKKMLWWDDVAKGLAKLNQPKDTPPENGETTNTTTTPTDSAPPATLSADGRAWFIHPVAMVGYFNIKSIGIVTYHIYHDGKIEKHIPQEILKGYEQKYKYVYHDKRNNIHQLGIYDYIEIQNNFYPHQRYGLTKYIHLIDLRNVSQDYSQYGLVYRFNVDSDQQRYFMNGDTLASFLGAMLEVNFTDISCNGFSTIKGGSGSSKSHRNGYHGDFKYLKKDGILTKGAGTSLFIDVHPELLDVERQNKWNDALYKFGWTNMLGWSYTLNGVKKFPNHITKDTNNHNHHLHVQFYDMKKVKEIKK